MIIVTFSYYIFVVLSKIASSKLFHQFTAACSYRILSRTGGDCLEWIIDNCSEGKLFHDGFVFGERNS